MDLPMIEEYDYKRDTKNTDLEIDLKPNTMIRDYQKSAMSKMFSNRRARSGIIVLPCGAGKTLTGITAACTIKKSTMVVCTSQVSCLQWKREFLKWCNILPQNIVIYTSKTKDSKESRKLLSFLYKSQEEQRAKSLVLICTYSMLGRKTPEEGGNVVTRQMMNFIQDHEWGLMLLDEVQVLPARNFSRITDKVKAHCKLGLSATLVREDGKIGNLHFLIGPKLYEANWIDL